MRGPQIVGLVAALLATSCADGGGSRLDAGSRRDATSALPDGGCGGGALRCGGECVEVEADRRHCGGCDRACASGEVCARGVCSSECPGEQTACDGACRDLEVDPAHCGDCGRACAGDERCVGGVCEGCAAPRMLCAGACVDVSIDARHCGTCGRACAEGERCASSACVLSCPSGQTVCGASCRDLLRDPMACGACGTACAPGETCEGGRCISPCPGGQILCGATCHDRLRDAMHCGACGNACATGERCDGGMCVLDCPAGQMGCGGSCRDLSSDRAHCGACFAACTASMVCSGGMCRAGMETSPFPQAGDTRVGADGLYFWRLGDYVQGTRATSLPSVGRVDVSLVVDPNVLTCDTQSVGVRINSVMVGSFNIAPGQNLLTTSFTFAPIAGPTYVVRYETIRQVASGCGSAGYPNDRGSTITFHAP